MARIKGKPKSPTQIAAERAAQRAKDLEAVGVSASVATLATGAAIEIVRAGEARGAQKAGHNVAWRADVFAALRSGMAAGAYDAARRLEADMAIRAGEGDAPHGAWLDRVDCEAGKDATDQRIDAGRRVDAVLGRVGDRDAWLLSELIRPGVERGWRDIVAHITGETNPHAQGAAVRSACANLAAAYGARRAA